MKRIAINGFGRIGRLTFRALLKRKDCEVVAINDLAAPSMLAHLLKYDTTQGRFDGTVEVADKGIIVNGRLIPVYNEVNPELLPWDRHQVDVCLECTGRFLTHRLARCHISAGAKKVILSAPAKEGPVRSVVLGASDLMGIKEDLIISNASCSTNCLALMAKVLQDKWGISMGFMSTIHAYTGNQRLIDAPAKDLRRSRAAAQNAIPTTTGAAKALGVILPVLEGKIYASCIRIPVPTGSLIELYVKLEKEASVEAINKAFLEASKESMAGVLEYCTDAVVSSDIIRNTASCVFDSLLTVQKEDMFKLTAWYDNEAGYSSRMADLVGLV